MKAVLLIFVGLSIGLPLGYLIAGHKDAPPAPPIPAQGRSSEGILESKAMEKPLPTVNASEHAERSPTQNEGSHASLQIDVMRRKHYLGNGFVDAVKWASSTKGLDPKYSPTSYDLRNDDVKYLFSLLWHETRALSQVGSEKSETEGVSQQGNALDASGASDF